MSLEAFVGWMQRQTIVVERVMNMEGQVGGAMRNLYRDLSTCSLAKGHAG